MAPLPTAALRLTPEATAAGRLGLDRVADLLPLSRAARPAAGTLVRSTVIGRPTPTAWAPSR